MVENMLKKVLEVGESPYRIKVSQEELDKYLVSPISEDEEKRILDKFKKELKGKNKKALFIARMQPLHYGHLLAMKIALQAAETLMIGIGSSNIADEDNPWTVEERERMLTNALEKNIDIKSGLGGIVRLPDYFLENRQYDDPKWVEETLLSTGDIDVVVSNNDWVCGLLSPKHRIINPQLFNREHFQGKIIRQSLRSRK